MAAIRPVAQQLAAGIDRGRRFMSRRMCSPPRPLPSAFPANLAPPSLAEVVGQFEMVGGQ
jgi:hypothetical protein